MHRFIYLLLGCLLLVGALFVVRMARIDVTGLRPAAGNGRAVGTYRSRMEATNELLKIDRVSEEVLEGL
jgi:hypothetical protein